MSKTPLPPKLLLRFFRWFCHPDLVKYVEGDLIELFHYNEKKRGKRMAKWLFTYELLKLMRPSLIKNLEGLKKLNHYGMFKNYLKTSVRSLNKNRLFSSINIVGLGMSISVGVLMILFLSEIYSFDNFHDQKDRIYRVNTRYTPARDGVKENLHATASIYIGTEIKEQVPGVERMLVMRQDMSADLKTKEDSIAITGYYVSATFFEVFSFKLIKGNPETALKKPNSIVLTQSTARKLFGEQDPTGEIVTVSRNTEFQTGIISGVVEDPPINSHLQFESLVSLSTLNMQAKEKDLNFRNDPLDFKSHIYVVLNKKNPREHAEKFLEEYAYKPSFGGVFTHFIQPLDEIVTSKDWYYDLSGPTFLPHKIYTMIGLTVIVLLSACFSYANLSLARALRRSKEVGIRKVNGASHQQVFAQFIVEAVVLALVALIIGLILFFLIRPEFLRLPNPTARGYQMLQLDIGYKQMLSFLILALGIGCIAGFFPALFLSKLKARVVFQDASRHRIFSGVTLRQTLVIVQFMLSIGLITSAVLVHKQYEFAIDYNKGFTAENIVNIEINRGYVKADLLENEFSKLPEVLKTSRSSYVLGEGWSGHGGSAMPNDRSDTIKFIQNYIDEKYLDMLGFEILAGSAFIQPLKENEKPKHIIVNEGFLSALNLGTPKEAIGKNVWIREHREDSRLRILGVVKDFVNVSLMEKSERPFAFFQSQPGEGWHMGVKINGADLTQTMVRLQDIYRKLDPLHPFQATFYEDNIAGTYNQHQATYTITSFLAFLTVTISTLGMLGMAVFTTESRMKEISIRKVLGAGMKSLSLLLSRSFVAMIIVAGIIAIPITWYIVENMLLNDFRYRADISLLDTLSGLLIVLLIGVITIGWQVREAAIQNPADLLRDE